VGGTENIANNMDAFLLMEISPAQLNVLSNLLQLYVHEINEYFGFSIALDGNGRYRIKPADKYLSTGWGYFIIVSCEYAGFILLNNNTKASEGVFIEEFFILPRYRRGLFFQHVIYSLFSELKGPVEFRVLKRNRRALFLFEKMAMKYLSNIVKTDEFENGAEYFRFTLDTTDIIKV
jgi:predicted acetyltransferase